MTFATADAYAAAGDTLYDAMIYGSTFLMVVSLAVAGLVSVDWVYSRIRRG